ncbi:MAG: hypothetical protein ABI675_26910 [Chitinophagaceae bacterium]
MLKFNFIITGFILLSFSSNGQYRRFESFIPAGFSLLDSASGDINKDGKKDFLLILINNHEETAADTTRPLLLLTGDGKGLYQLAERNDSVVLCKGCGGVFGDPYACITIKNGFFSIEHYGGSNWRWSRVITFKYDVKLKQFVVHRDAGDSFHTSNPDKVTTHVYHKEDFGKLLFANYSYERASDK